MIDVNINNQLDYRNEIFSTEIAFLLYIVLSDETVLNKKGPVMTQLLDLTTYLFVVASLQLVDLRRALTALMITVVGQLYQYEIPI